mgnify:CR=1 FL=1
MSDEKKLRFLKPETVEKLKLCMEMASTDAIDLITEAENSLRTKIKPPCY